MPSCLLVLFQACCRLTVTLVGENLGMLDILLGNMRHTRVSYTCMFWAVCVEQACVRHSSWHYSRLHSGLC